MALITNAYPTPIEDDSYTADVVFINGIEAVQVSSSNVTFGSRAHKESALGRRDGRNDGSSMADAVSVRIDCTNQEDNCDQDAAAIMCLGKPDVLQRLSDGDPNYRASGAARTPFNGDRLDLAQLGVDRPPTPDGEEPFNSAEEFPFESSAQGGSEAWLFPTQRTQQSSQGARLRQTLAGFQVLENGGWYRIVDFEHCDRQVTDPHDIMSSCANLARPYCNAFRAKDYSICDREFDRDWLKFARRRISLKGRPYKFAPPSIAKVMKSIQRGGSNYGSNW
ncbi:hypothetical protein B0A48_17327 [Cryoendolithus antarcticus]|uniref:Deoxyribonuclease NucA/NucB domain-containing protein n=1 Tax=Cryoendolithus antarcticus TaxID=1507870 RepID=A0A1V8SCD8_9PEZI|nr:hypothetical protein B0A48_17327 [Cryoendolithus antarcticus]